MKVTVSVAIAAIFVILSMLSGQDRSFIESEIRRWQREVERNPRDYETLGAIGAAYGKLGEHTTSIVYFKKAIAVNPSYTEGYLALGTAYGFLRQPTEAILALRRAISLSPKNPYVHLKLGTTLAKAEQYPEAITELKEAVKLKPDWADAHFALGLAYMSIGDRQRTLAEVDVLTGLNQQLAGQLRDLASRGK